MAEAAAPFVRSDEPDGAPRLRQLDVLRGIAILGILFMNMDAMGAAMNGFFLGDPGRLGWTGVDQAIWWVRQVLAEGTARCLLEMLFGAGMVILTERVSLARYAWRNVVLFGFGLIHVFVLLWPGDILHTYALAALVCMGLRRAPPRLLLTIGLSLAAVQLGGGVLDRAVGAVQRATMTAAQIAANDGRDAAAQASDHADALARVAAEDRARTGSARGWTGSLWGAFRYMEGLGMEVLFVWEAASTMLIGAALFRWGVLQGWRDRRFYAVACAIGYGVGIPLRIWAAWALTRFEDALSLAPAFGEVARLLVTLGHLGLVTLLLGTMTGARVLQPFATAGRTALSLYVGQTLVCQWVIYPPWGLALYGRQGWAGLMATALLVDAALLALAVWWVRRFRMAPVEWAWRSIVEGRALGWREGHR